MVLRRIEEQRTLIENLEKTKYKKIPCLHDLYIKRKLKKEYMSQIAKIIIYLFIG